MTTPITQEHILAKLATPCQYWTEQEKEWLCQWAYAELSKREAQKQANAAAVAGIIKE